MKLIIIYGPPAVGKLTVAKELSKITQFEVFHNHQTIDALKAIIDTKEKHFSERLMESRLEVIEAAAKKHLKGIIFTSGYHGQPTDKTIDGMIKILKKHNGKVYFVRLVCDRKELFKRVKSSERKKYSKTSTVKELTRLLPKWDFNEVPYKENLIIDNTYLSARKAAKKIKEHYCL